MKKLFAVGSLAISLGISIFVWQAHADSANPISLPSTIVEDSKKVEWVADSMAKMATIHKGMKRSQLLQVFTIEGGLYNAEQQRFVYRGCPYFKVDVTFTPADKARDKDGRLLSHGSPNDVIESISRPYLEYPICD